jgi:hypothetical protein
MEVVARVDDADLTGAVVDLDLDLVLVGSRGGMLEDVGARFRDRQLDVRDAVVADPKRYEGIAAYVPGDADACFLAGKAQGESDVHGMKVPPGVRGKPNQAKNSFSRAPGEGPSARRS